MVSVNLLFKNSYSCCLFSLQEILISLIFKVFDRTDMILKLEILKKILLSITIFYGILVSNVNYLFYGFVLTAIFSFLINYYYAKKVQMSFFGMKL